MTNSRLRPVLPASPTISVVIISRNEGEQLAATVANMRETLPRELRELIVVDDASTDGSAEFLRDDPEVRLISSD